MNTRAPTRGPAISELSAALAACRGAFIGTAAISGMSNILQLTGSLFMLEVYDRVLPSRSVPTLVGLIVLVAFLYAALGVIDAVRSRILARVGAALDEQLSGRVYDTLVQLPLRIGGRSEGNQPLRDLDAIRAYLSSLGPVALFDLPWMPLYLGICFIFHPLLGLTALAGAIILIVLTLMTEIMLRAPNKAATEAAIMRNSLAESSRRNAEVLTAMGMVGRMATRWGDANRQYMANQGRASDVAGGLGSISKVLRMMLQSVVLAVGAYLVIHQEASAGIIIAGSILSARALAPVDLGHRQLARLHGRPLGLGAPEQAAGGTAGTRGTDGIAAAHPPPLGRGRQRRAARRPESRRPGHRLQARGRPGARHHRPERLRQVVAGAALGRRLATAARQRAPRRRGARPMVARRARRPHRLSAARRRVAHRHGGAEHRPLRSRARQRSRHCRRQGGRRA